MKGTALPALLARALAGALVLTLSLSASAAERGPSTPAERKRAVDVTRRLERSPLATGANAERVWLMNWIKDIPDITIRTCSGLLDPLAVDDEAKYGRKLFAQAMFGMTTFMIENPRRREDWVAVQTAGVESTLRAYQALVQAHPEARWDMLDKLISAQKEGRLSEIVESALEGCGDERSPGPGEAI